MKKRNVEKRGFMMIMLSFALCMMSLLGNGKEVKAETKEYDIAVDTSTPANATGTLEQSGDIDEYVLRANEESSYYEIAIDSNQSVYLNVYDSQRKLLYSNSGEVFTRYFKFKSNKTYYINIKLGFYSGYSNYALHIKQIKDESDDLSGAERVEIGLINEGYLSPLLYGRNYNNYEGDVDYFKIKTGSTKAYYTIQCAPDEDDTRINYMLLDSDGFKMEYQTYVSHDGRTSKVVLEPNRYYYLKIEGSSAYYYNSNYRFKITKGSDIKVKKSNQAINVSPLSKTLSYTTLKKKSQVFKLKTTAKTTPVFKKVSGDGKISISSNGVVTVKPGLKKKTYSVRVQVSAPSSTYYNAASRTVTLQIKVK